MDCLCIDRKFNDDTEIYTYTRNVLSGNVDKISSVLNVYSTPYLTPSVPYEKYLLIPRITWQIKGKRSNTNNNAMSHSDNVMDTIIDDCVSEMSSNKKQKTGDFSSIIEEVTDKIIIVEKGEKYEAYVNEVKDDGSIFGTMKSPPTLSINNAPISDEMRGDVPNPILSTPVQSKKAPYNRKVVTGPVRFPRKVGSTVKASDANVNKGLIKKVVRKK